MGTSLGRVERRTNRPRRGAHRPTASVSLPTGENEDGQKHECPVCMTSMDNGNVFSFPCGHCVCTECDVKLQGRGFYSCPTCREPRAGYSTQDVDEAANARVNRDRLNEAANGQQTVSTTTLEHNGSFYHVIFLNDESSTARPYDVLRTVDADGTLLEAGEGNAASARHPQDATNAPDTPDNPDVSGRNTISVSGPLAEMLHGLVQPSSMGAFLQRHNALSTLLTARNTRPRFL